MTLITEAWGVRPHKYCNEGNQKSLLASVEKRRKITETAFSKRCIGLEVEIEYAALLDAVRCSLFQMTTDGSLRPADMGRELISQPVGGVLIDHALFELGNVFTTLYEGDPVNEHFSHRTSIHVHVDVTDYTTEQLLTLVAVYLCIENVLLSAVDPLRTKNNFCAPLSSMDVTRDLVLDPQNHRGNMVKYFAMNFGTASRLGTVEFRALEGTSDIGTIHRWIKAVQGLVDFVVGHKTSTLRERIMMLNTNSEYQAFADAILPGFYVPDFKYAMEDNIALAKRLIS